VPGSTSDLHQQSPFVCLIGLQHPITGILFKALRLCVDPFCEIVGVCVVLLNDGVHLLIGVIT